MTIQLNRSQQKFVLLLLIAAIYTVLIIQFDFLNGIKIKDEGHFWETSLTFSDTLIPSMEDLRNYQELNTPLPFMVFGVLEYFFHQGIFAGRLLNLILSLIIVFTIAWPNKAKQGRGLSCLIGLLTCPYFLLNSVRLYTDIIACFCLLMGFIAYVRNRHLLSSIAFILAIASRQYMLAFPMAIATYEFIVSLTKIKTTRQFDLSQQWRWIAPSIAVLSIFGWIYLFQGLAPSSGIEEMAPTVQKSTWDIQPSNATYFLSFVSVFIVIPEFILFTPQSILQSLKQKWRKVALIALGLLLFCIIFPPPTGSEGIFSLVLNLLHYEILKQALFYVLALIACIRFSQPNLIFISILFNCLIMMKAHTWSKYVLPLSVVFWYLKSIGLEDEFNLSSLFSKWLSCRQARSSE